MTGAYVRQIREEKGYLLRQMAALLDVDPTILSKMEREERPFKREQILKFASICELDEEKLVTMWLADKICNMVGDDECALNALDLAKKQTVNGEK